MASKTRVFKSKDSTASKYPTTEEKTTLAASLALVKSTKVLIKNVDLLSKLAELLFIFKNRVQI